LNRQSQHYAIVALSASFVSERPYLQNVSPKTLEWHKCSFNAYEPYTAAATNQNELPARRSKSVMEMSEAGKLSLTSINDYARCLNAFLKWLADANRRATLAQQKDPCTGNPHRQRSGRPIVDC
jgi:hypothetical protein